MALAYLRLLVIDDLEDEEQAAERVPREIRERKSPFELDDTKFIKLYRLTKAVTTELITDLTPHMRAPSRSSALTTEIKVLAALRFFAGGPYQGYVGGDIYTGMDQSSVSRSISEVAAAITTHLMPRWITFDLSPESVAELRQQFFVKYGFPGCIGAIDCTHVAIIAPPVNHPQYMERQYFNHKRFHSINVQLVCDSSMRILNVNARYPGATNDSYIYANSNLRQGLLAMQREFNTNAWLIGDSGYPLETCLLTPVPGNVELDSPEDRYNRSICRARSIVEQCNGVLKERWRCILKHRVLHYMPEKASRIINSCCVLHNMCLAGNVPPPEEPQEEEEEDNLVDDVQNDRAQNMRPAGRMLREHIIRQYFT